MRTGLRLALLALALAAPAALGAITCPYTEINLNTTVSGALTTSDCGSDTFADYYRFFAAAGTTLTANVRTKGIGNVVLSIVDFESGDSLIRDIEVDNANVTFKTQADAFYLVRISSLDADSATGTYVLKLAGVKNANGCSADVDPATLCVNSDRFKIRVAWNAVHQGTQGDGTAIALTSDTGSFWFFESTNLELVIKVLDARSINGHFWVFYGALTNVAYTVTVTDTLTGIVKTYSSPQDTQASVADTAAF